LKLRSYLILLVVAAVLPVVGFGGYLSYRSYEEQREMLAQGMIERCRAISAALDREFLVSIQSLKVLAGSTHLRGGNLKEFYGDMQGALAAYRRTWENLTLVDAAGRQLINLRRPFGAPLPKTGNPEAIEQARASREAVIADISPGPVTGAPGIVVHVPIVRDGAVTYFLNAIFYPAPLTDLLVQQKLPDGWVATIIDRKHNVAARTRDVAKFIGKPAAAAFSAQARRHQEAAWRGISLDGAPVFAALHRSELTGWTVGIAVPIEQADAPLRRSLFATAAGGLVFLLIALGLAAALGRRIAAPVAALSQAAEKLGSGEAPAMPQSPIAEVNHLANALGDAAERRFRSEARIRQLNRVYAVLSDINQAIVRVRDPQALLAEACRIAVEKGGFRLAWIGRIDPASGEFAVDAAAGFSDGFVERHAVRGAGQLAPAGAPRSGREICNDIASDPRAAAWRDAALSRGYRAYAGFPLAIGAEAVGVFNLYAGEREVFNGEELLLLDELAADIGLALEIHRKDAEKLRVEQSLGESEERFRQLTENIREVFWLTAADQRRIFYVSPAYETIWGRSCRSLYESPRDWLDAIHPEDRAAVLKAALTRRAAGDYDQEYRIVRPDGEIRWIHDRAFPVRDSAGAVYRIAGIAEDITERKKAAEALKRVNEDLEARVQERTRALMEANLKLRDVDRLKSEFLANMSHELRTPLNAIIGFSEIIQDGKAGAISAEQKEYLGDILSSARHLLRLINDVLDLSKVEAGRMEILPSTFSIDEMLAEVTQNVAPIMSVKGLKLVREIADDFPPITADRSKLLQILLNLASNAVKFTDRGAITIAARVRPDAPGAQAPAEKTILEFQVRDTGSGIKAEDLPLLFQPFTQLEPSLQKRHEGTGLGLHLSRRLAELLGGELSVESAYGKGSTFTLILPRNPRT